VREEKPQLKVAAHSARKGETILLVEDAAPLREITREFLEGSGYRVLEAHCADLALQVAEGHKAPIALMITDLVMPGKNGRALADHLRLVRPETKVLFISGYADDALFRNGVLPTGINLLHKPYTQDELTSKLRALLDAAS
jgi:CheY-like chemotaxis protein